MQAVGKPIVVGFISILNLGYNTFFQYHALRTVLWKTLRGRRNYLYYNGSHGKFSSAHYTEVTETTGLYKQQIKTSLMY